MQCGSGLCGHCQLGPYPVCRDGPVVTYGGLAAELLSGAPNGEPDEPRPAWPCGSSPRATAASSASSTARTNCWPWSARCEIAYFTEMSRAAVAGPYDVSLVEGSVTTAERRRADPRGPGLVADAGHHRGLRHGRRHPGPAQLRRRSATTSPPSTPTPSTSPPWSTSTPISAHVPVDFELQGCPIDRRQLLEVLTAYLAGRAPGIPGHTRVPGVQGPRHRLRPRGRGDPVPRAR